MLSNARYLIPNFVTLTSLCLGVVATTLAARGEYQHALWTAFLCTILDKFDGALARRFHATSSFGVEMDSLADVVAFGVAPAVVVYLTVIRFSPHFSGNAHWFALAAALFYASASALRLAKYNVIAQAGEFNQVFQGIPMPFAAGLVLAPLLLMLKYFEPAGYEPHLLDTRWVGTFSSPTSQHALFSLMVPLQLLVGYGMISRLKVPKLTLPKVPWMKIYISIHGFLTYFLVLTRTSPEILNYIAFQFLFISVYFTFKVRKDPSLTNVSMLKAMGYQLELVRREDPPQG